MQRAWAAGIIVLLSAVPVLADEPAGKLLSETWDAAFLEGTKAGYIHTSVRELDLDGQTVHRVHRQMELTLKRFRDTVQVSAEVGTIETPAGKVIGLFFNQGLGKTQTMALVGKVNGKILNITITGSAVPGEKVEQQHPWDDSALGLIGEENLIRDRQAKPGDTFSYRYFEVTVNNIVTTQVAVKDWDTIPLNGAPRKLLRVELKPEKIEGVQLPTQTLWFDMERRLIKSQVEMPGLGELTLNRGTKEEALKPAGEVRDMATLQEIVLNKAIPRPHEQSSILYRLTFAKGDDIEKMFSAGDDRQQVKVVGPKSIELRVTPVRRPGTDDKALPPGEPYLASNFFINSKDEVVRKHATAAVGQETDPWKKAQLIERWVHDNMRALNFTEAMATADQVARTLEGDCSEFSMLAAAMCRAEGIPSRTALGLVYHVDGEQPKLAFHMWTEVWVRGRWLALDATLGAGSVGPAHLKITDHSWYETSSMVPLLPVMRVLMNKPKVEVLKIGQ